MLIRARSAHLRQTNKSRRWLGHGACEGHSVAAALELSGLSLAYPPTTPGRLIYQVLTLSQPGRGLHLSIRCVDVTSSVVLLSASDAVGSLFTEGQPLSPYQRHKTYLTRLCPFSASPFPFRKTLCATKSCLDPFCCLTACL